MFVYEVMLNGGWIELSKNTVNYFAGSIIRRRFRLWVMLQRIFNA